MTRSRLYRFLIVALLLLGLAHAWSVHDAQNGHTHPELGEVTYSTKPGPRQDLQALFQAAWVDPLASASFARIAAPQVVLWEVTEEADGRVPSAVPIAHRLIPRPPPSELSPS